MSYCSRCGQEIEFKYINGRPVPIHIYGGYGCGVGGEYSSSNHNYARVIDYCSVFEEICKPTSCPHCGAMVFFIRHNGGSVWIDELGWPWPKHKCFIKDAEPKWVGYFEKNVAQSNKDNLFFGVVVDVKRIFQKKLGLSRIYLALDAGIRGRVIVIVDGTTSEAYLKGRLFVLDPSKTLLWLSSHDEKKVYGVSNQPEIFGLSSDWLEKTSVKES